MVNYKSKYLKYKLKYHKITGGMESSPRRLNKELLAFMVAVQGEGSHESFPRSSELSNLMENPSISTYMNEAIFEQKVNLINEYLGLSWMYYNADEWGELREIIYDFNKKLSGYYKPYLSRGPGHGGWSLNSSKIKENPNNIDFNKLSTTIEKMKNIGFKKNPYNKWDGIFNDL